VTAALVISIAGLTESAPAPLREPTYSGAAGVASPSASGRAQELNLRVSAPEHCRSARRGTRFYLRRANEHRSQRNARKLELARPLLRSSCNYERWRSRLWRGRALAERRSTERWERRKLASRTLRETPYDGRRDPWPANVREVQRVFPGTERWILSCSDAEGWEPGLTYWATYGWGRYYPGFEDRYVVGGPGQFKYPTFLGMYRFALTYARERSFIVPAHLRTPGVTAWRSPFAQAMAMGWARFTGNDDSHWSASFGRGC
jgi:hypothetical protein